MCHSITAFLPSDANLHASEVIFDQHTLGLRRISNPFVQAQAQAGDIYILTTRKHCDCGTPLGSLQEDVMYTFVRRVLDHTLL